jgi:universal stress protein A
MMSDYSHILAAIDFSTAADHVLNKASEIASRNKAKLSLLHVVEYLPPIDSAFDPMLAGNWMLDEDTLLENARQSLEKLSDRHDLKNVALDVRLGTPKQEIINYVEDQQCDLVIMSSHGRHGLNILLGSTANAVLHAMPCDILTVKVEE